MRKKIFGAAIGIAGSIGLGSAMVPLRSHLAVATIALVLTIPVIVSALLAGFLWGIASVIAGFFVYDTLFVPPYNTLTIGTSQNWLAVVVYVIITVVIVWVVTSLTTAREATQLRASNARHLIDLSELLLVDKPVDQLAATVVVAVRSAFGLDGTALLLSVNDRLEIVASSGTPISASELARLRPEARVPVALSTATSHDAIQTLALVSAGRPVGLLVLRNVPTERALRDVLHVLANHLAIALERAQLHERILHAELLEEIDRLRRSLLGAVSHDLRTPLATIKVASSALLERASALSEEDSKELYSLIDLQADRLTRLVNSLLDMTRIQSGSLEVRRKPVSIVDLANEAIEELGASLGDRRIEITVSEPSPIVDADPLLVVQVIANLVDNAHRLSPASAPITIAATLNGNDQMIVSVTDEGPGVPASEHESIFETFVRFDTGGRSGLGLAIAKAFIEAHGEHIWVQDAPDGGARFAFSLTAVHANTAGT